MLISRNSRNIGNLQRLSTGLKITSGLENVSAHKVLINAMQVARHTLTHVDNVRLAFSHKLLASTKKKHETSPFNKNYASIIWLIAAAAPGNLSCIVQLAPKSKQLMGSRCGGVDSERISLHQDQAHPLMKRSWKRWFSSLHLTLTAQSSAAMLVLKIIELSNRICWPFSTASCTNWMDH